jgi:hypothetical protein
VRFGKKLAVQERNACEKSMERNGKTDEKLRENTGKLQGNSFGTLFEGSEHLILTGVVEAKYTTQEDAG